MRKEKPKRKLEIIKNTLPSKELLTKLAQLDIIIIKIKNLNIPLVCIT